MDYRAREERRNEALTKRWVVKIGNNWRKFKGEKLEDDARNLYKHFNNYFVEHIRGDMRWWRWWWGRGGGGWSRKYWIKKGGHLLLTWSAGGGGAKRNFDLCHILLVFIVTPFKIDQNKNQNRSINKVQNLGNERRYPYKDPRQDSG